HTKWRTVGEHSWRRTLDDVLDWPLARPLYSVDGRQKNSGLETYTHTHTHTHRADWQSMTDNCQLQQRTLLCAAIHRSLPPSLPRFAQFPHYSPQLSTALFITFTSSSSDDILTV